MIKNKNNKNLIVRPPIVVILGHVDSGKTSLLDYIRKKYQKAAPEGGEPRPVAGRESGGITQHIGAYQIEHKGKKITFIDTPGHEAFSAMRARGAKAADIAVLIVDVTKGVEPQTKEAILHIQKADIPFIVALNKIDRSEADIERTKGDLAKEGVLLESFGGKIPSVGTSATSGAGVEDLLEMIVLVAEMENLKTDQDLPVEGWILEARLDSQSGIIVSLILSQGALKIGDVIGTPSAAGRIKSLNDFLSKTIERAEPADPVLVSGFESLPKAGEVFKGFSGLETAKQNIEKMEAEPARVVRQAVAADGQKVLSLVIKADYSGSLEAIDEVLREIPQEKVALQILKLEVGDIDEADIKSAKASQAKILGFRVKTGPVAKSLALRDKIKIIDFEVIYDLVETIRKLMELRLSPDISRIDLGKIKILANFSAEKGRQVIGGKVLTGEIRRGSQIEVSRLEEIIGKGKLVNLQKNKKDVEKCAKGDECGMLFEGETKIEEGDILIFYTEERTKAEL